MTDADVEVALDGPFELGEGPIWDAARRCLLFVDIMRGHVHVFDPETRHDHIIEVGQPVSAIAPTVRGDWVMAMRDGFGRLDPDTGRTTMIASVEAGRPTRMNDGYVDSRGRFWAGSMSLVHEPNQGSLYRLDPDGSVHRMLDAVSTSNGIDWSPDDARMYYVDTGTRRVDVFDFDAEAGTIANCRTFAAIDPAVGKPDGLVVDALGGIWVAIWRGGRVHRYTPGGQLDRVVHCPTVLTTKPAFAGPTLEDLYITSATTDLSAGELASQPHAGALFRLRPGVAGKPGHLYGG